MNRGLDGVLHCPETYAELGFPKAIQKFWLYIFINNSVNKGLGQMGWRYQIRPRKSSIRWSFVLGTLFAVRREAEIDRYIGGFQ